MRFKHLFIAAIFLLNPLRVLAEQFPVVSLPNDAVDVPAETVGTVIGTIGVSSPAQSMFASVTHVPIVRGSLFFRRAGSGEFGTLDFARTSAGIGGNTKALSDGDAAYAAFKMDLPEGEYEIFRASASYDHCMPGFVCNPRYVVSANEREFSVPFMVKRGRVLYLGSFLARGTVARGYPLQPDTAYYSYANKWQRDSSLFGQGTLAIDPSLVEPALLAVDGATAYYLIAEDHLPSRVWKRGELKAGLATFAAKVEAHKAVQANARK